MYYLDMKDKEGAIVLTMVIGDKRGRRRDRLRRFDVYMTIIKLIKKISIFVLLIRAEIILVFRPGWKFYCERKISFLPSLRVIGQTYNRLDNRCIYISREKKRLYFA